MKNRIIFAVRKIIENCLYAIQYEGDDDEFENYEFREVQSSNDEFRRLFNNWSDPEYLEAFFEKHKSDLQKGFYNFISIERAIERTIDEANELEQKLIEIAEQGKTNNYENLQTLFKPLNKSDEDKYPIPDYQKSKAYGSARKSWLRIYAIRIDHNLFIVTGGAIKLTDTMNEREHLLKELEKLSQTKEFLIEKGIIDSDSIVDFLQI